MCIYARVGDSCSKTGTLIHLARLTGEMENLLYAVHNSLCEFITRYVHIQKFLTQV